MSVKVKREMNGTIYRMEVKGGPAGGDYFSVTGDIFPVENPRSGVCGAVGQELLEAFPWAKPLVDLHLSDNSGVPMHAAENGWYWAGGTEWNSPSQDDPPNSFHLASHLRIPQEDADDIVRKVALKEMDKAEFKAFVEAQRPRWGQEAEQANKTIRSHFEIPEVGRELEQRMGRRLTA